MHGVDTKTIFSGGRCVRTSFVLEDPRFTEVLPDKIQIQVGRLALPMRLPQIAQNLASKYSVWQADAVCSLVSGVFAPEPVDQVAVQRIRGELPTVAVCYHNSFWLSGNPLEQCHTTIYWAFATLLTTSVA